MNTVQSITDEWIERRSKAPRRSTERNEMSRRSNYDQSRSNIINADYCPWIINAQIIALERAHNE